MDELIERSGRIAAHTRAVAAAVCLTAAAAVALAAGPADVVISHAWVRPTVPGQPVAAAYMDISSARAGTVTHIESDAAGVVQMHSMSMDGDIMRMRQLAQLPLTAGQTVRLAPSGTHLMLLQLKRPLRPGDTVKFDITVVDAGGHREVVRTAATVQQTGDGEAR